MLWRTPSVVFPVSGYEQRWRGRGKRCSSASNHVEINRSRQPVRLSHRQGGFENQGNSRGHWCVHTSRIWDASQFHRASGNHFRHRRGHYTMHLPHMLCYARGEYFFHLKFYSRSKTHNTLQLTLMKKNIFKCIEFIYCLDFCARPSPEA